MDIAAAITRGLAPDGDGHEGDGHGGNARRTMFSEAAIAASWQVERLGIGPYPLRFLARHVRAAGCAGALNLPEPLIGAEATQLVRVWLTAASAADEGLAGDDQFAQWLDMVAALIAIRRKTRGQDRPDIR